MEDIIRKAQNELSIYDRVSASTSSELLALCLKFQTIREAVKAYDDNRNTLELVPDGDAYNELFSMIME